VFPLTSHDQPPASFPDFPFVSRYAQVAGWRMHYLDEGQGEPVVLVHGNPNWCYYWRRLIPFLADRFRCLACDHLGCGWSDKPSASQYRYTLAQRVQDLETWLDGLGLRAPISLVVHDWGGMIGFAYATRYPERIRKLVVLNSAAFRLPESKPVPWQLRLARMPIVGACLVRGLNAFSRGAVRSCVTRRPLAPAVARAYCAPYDSWAHRIAVHRFVQDIPLRPGDPAWSTVMETEHRLSLLADKPLLIGWGDRDFVFDHHFLAEWRRRFPQAIVHRFADCGHYVLEDAADELLPLIRDFL